MKERMMKKLSQAIVVASALTAGLAGTQAAHAEISASMDLATAYLWRGQSLSYGTGVVSGSLDYANESGLYAGVWTSSGDTTYGTEVDLYAGFAGETNGIGYDVAVIGYVYPDSNQAEADKYDNWTELSLGLSYDIVSVSFAKAADSDKSGDYLYAALGLEFDAIGLTLGNVSGSEGTTFSTDYTHIDVSYAYNDQISFGLSKVIDEDIEDEMDKSLKYVISYSLPIE
jgi:uncharacterized protein (TIGR02001 family)